MQAVENWIIGFMTLHAKRHELTKEDDFPRRGTELNTTMIDAWTVGIQNINASEQEADRASLELFSDPPRRRLDHLPALIKKILERREKDRASLPAYATRDAAKSASGQCRYCGETTAFSRGERIPTGNVTVYHPLYVGSAVLMPTDDPDIPPDAPERRITTRTAARVVLHCVCPLGRWYTARNPQEAGERKVWTFQDVLDGRLNWKLEDPTEANQARLASYKKRAAVAVNRLTAKPATTPASQPKAQAAKPELEQATPGNGKVPAF